MIGSVQAINIVFDGQPAPDGGRFVEVETDDGRSISIGQWLQRPDGSWALRIENVPTTAAAAGRDAGSAGEKPGPKRPAVKFWTGTARASPRGASLAP